MNDSKREVLRFLKVLDAASFPANQLSLVGVSNVDTWMKQSPDGQERQQEIYRVPVFILKQNGIEVSRVVEYPVISLERDLMRMVPGALLTQWLREGLLIDDNVSYRGLANQVRSFVATEGELHAAAAVLVGRNLMQEAVQLFRMNAYLYPESPRRRLALAKALQDIGEHEEAAHSLKKALELNDDPEQQDPILALWDRVRESQRLKQEATKEQTQQ